jgi:hypothetical protein
MSTNRSLLFRSTTTGRPEIFDGESTLTWNFTSVAGDPVVVQVSGTDYFTGTRDGDFSIERNYLVNTDGAGDIGETTDHRPDNINAATQIAVGATGGLLGSRLTLNTLTLGHGNVDKHIDADQGLGNTPSIRYNAIQAKWQYANDGVTWVNFGVPGGPVTWDDIYLSDKTLTIDTSALIWTQTSTSGNAFHVTRNLASGSTDSAIVKIENVSSADDQFALEVSGLRAVFATGLSNFYAVTPDGGGGADISVLTSNPSSSGGTGLTATDTLAAINASITPNAGDDASAVWYGLYAYGSSVGAASKYGVYTDSDWDWGGLFNAPVQVTTSATVAKEALYLHQVDDDVTFVKFEGTTAADETKSISSVNGATADMLRVEVDDGSAADRWVPAFASATLGFKSYDFIPIEWAQDGASPPAVAETVTSGNGSVNVRKFSGSSVEDVTIPWIVPNDIVVANGIKFNVIAYVTEGTGPSSEGVSFKLKGYSIGHGDALNGAFGTAVESNKTGMTEVQYNQITTDQSGTVTVTDMAGGEVAMLNLYRDTADADDTYVQDVGVVGIEIEYTKLLTA